MCFSSKHWTLPTRFKTHPVWLIEEENKEIGMIYWPNIGTLWKRTWSQSVNIATCTDVMMSNSRRVIFLSPAMEPYHPNSSGLIVTCASMSYSFIYQCHEIIYRKTLTFSGSVPHSSPMTCNVYHSYGCLNYSLFWVSFMSSSPLRQKIKNSYIDLIYDSICWSCNLICIIMFAWHSFRT